MMDNLYYIGIDIAKAKFDLAFIENNQKFHRIFDNSKKGFKELSKFLKEKEIKKAHFTMEATNIYWQDLTEYLQKNKDFIVSVVNPLQISSYAKCLMQRGKTDKVDAFLLARFCQNERPEAWKPLNKSTEKLLKLIRQCEHLKEMKSIESVRLQTADKLIQTSIKATITHLSKQIKVLEKMIMDYIKSDKELYEGFKLLKSIPGIGDTTAPFFGLF